MADKISALPAVGTLTGAKLVPVVQGGVTSQTTASALAGCPPGSPVRLLGQGADIPKTLFWTAPRDCHVTVRLGIAVTQIDANNPANGLAPIVSGPVVALRSVFGIGRKRGDFVRAGRPQISAKNGWGSCRNGAVGQRMMVVGGGFVTRRAPLARLTSKAV